MPMRVPLFLATLLAVLPISLGTPAVGAQVTTMTDCEESPFSGSWVSSDPNKRFLSKLDISDICKQIITKPVASNNPWAGAMGHETSYIHRSYTLRPTSTCSPADCAWGRARGEMADKGQLKAQFRMFWSQRFLELTRENDTLRVRWRIEYLGRKKPDQLGETLLVRAE